ncbi:MAG: nuclease A inhibitor family protein [Polyangiaceae bacterium]
MRTAKLFATLLCGALLLNMGCAAEATDAPAGEEENASEDNLTGKPSDAVLTKDITAAAKPTLYMSESDYPFKFVMATMKPGETISQDTVRRAFADVVNADPDADKPMATLHADTNTFKEWRKNFYDCASDEYQSCIAINHMNSVISKSLSGVKVFYFGAEGSRGRVDGTAVSIFVVGKTKSGKIAGVRTLAIWT